MPFRETVLGSLEIGSPGLPVVPLLQVRVDVDGIQVRKLVHTPSVRLRTIQVMDLQVSWAQSGWAVMENQHCFLEVAGGLRFEK